MPDVRQRFVTLEGISVMVGYIMRSNANHKEVFGELKNINTANRD